MYKQLLKIFATLVIASTLSVNSLYAQVSTQSNGNGTRTGQSQSQVQNPIGFTGQRYDQSTGLNHFLYRAYSPDLGRWQQRDPAGYVDGVNLYEYVTGQPMVKTDPLGLQENAPWWARTVVKLTGGEGRTWWDDKSSGELFVIGAVSGGAIALAGFGGAAIGGSVGAALYGTGTIGATSGSIGAASTVGAGIGASWIGGELAYDGFSAVGLPVVGAVADMAFPDPTDGAKLATRLPRMRVSKPCKARVSIESPGKCQSDACRVLGRNDLAKLIDEFVTQHGFPPSRGTLFDVLKGEGLNPRLLEHVFGRDKMFGGINRGSDSGQPHIVLYRGHVDVIKDGVYHLNGKAIPRDQIPDTVDRIIQIGQETLPPPGSSAEMVRIIGVDL